MATVKITDLPPINTINANTANTVLVGVDIANNITGKITLTTLAANLYSNNNLVENSQNNEIKTYKLESFQRIILSIFLFLFF